MQNGPSDERTTAGDRPARMGGRRLPHLIRFLGLNMAIGVAIGVIVASAMIMSNLAGLKELLIETREPFIAILLLYAFNALTFGSVAMGVAVMTIPYDSICNMRDPNDNKDAGPLR
jgi:hypothetical protein